MQGVALLGSRRRLYAAEDYAHCSPPRGVTGSQADGAPCIAFFGYGYQNWSPPGYGPQVLVLSICQGKPFEGYPIFDSLRVPHVPSQQPLCGSLLHDEKSRGLSQGGLRNSYGYTSKWHLPLYVGKSGG